VDFLAIFVAFFFALLMCLGLILVKWIILQLGATLFSLIVFLMISVFLLAIGDREHEDE
jgi:hypothetical protein